MKLFGWMKCRKADVYSEMMTAEDVGALIEVHITAARRLIADRMDEIEAMVDLPMWQRYESADGDMWTRWRDLNEELGDLKYVAEDVWNEHVEWRNRPRIDSEREAVKWAEDEQFSRLSYALDESRRTGMAMDIATTAPAGLMRALKMVAASTGHRIRMQSNGEGTVIVQSIPGGEGTDWAEFRQKYEPEPLTFAAWVERHQHDDGMDTPEHTREIVETIAEHAGLGMDDVIPDELYEVIRKNV